MEGNGNLRFEDLKKEVDALWKRIDDIRDHGTDLSKEIKIIVNSIVEKQKETNETVSNLVRSHYKTEGQKVLIGWAIAIPSLIWICLNIWNMLHPFTGKMP